MCCSVTPCASVSILRVGCWPIAALSFRDDLRGSHCGCSKAAALPTGPWGQDRRTAVYLQRQCVYRADDANTLLLLAIIYAIYRYMQDYVRRQSTLEQEFKSARELQQVLIPETLPALPGFAVHQRLPARAGSGRRLLPDHPAGRRVRRLHADCAGRRERQRPQGRHDGFA